MNPAIHHPRWYLATKLLTESEVHAAEASVPANVQTGEVGPAALVCSSVVSQFTVGTLRIACLQGNWSITTVERSSFDRADISGAVFEALPHTPISAYGLNFAFHRETRLPVVGDYLARLMESLPLGLVCRSGRRRSSVSFRYHTKDESNETVAVIEPSVRGAHKLFVGVNITHQIKARGLFDLRPMLNQSFESDTQEAEVLLNGVLTNIGRADGGANL